MLKNGMRPVHPGEILRADYLVPLGMSANAPAKALNVPAPRIKSGAGSPRTRPCVWRVISAATRARGSTCRRRMTCVWRRLKTPSASSEKLLPRQLDVWGAGSRESPVAVQDGERHPRQDRAPGARPRAQRAKDSRCAAARHLARPSRILRRRLADRDRSSHACDAPRSGTGQPRHHHQGAVVLLDDELERVVEGEFPGLGRGHFGGQARERKGQVPDS
jgi:hypothetical protein